jgi:hypothetical protein
MPGPRPGSTRFWGVAVNGRPSLSCRFGAARGVCVLLGRDRHLLPSDCGDGNLSTAGSIARRENASTGREKQSSLELPAPRSVVYVSGHVAGETRRRTRTTGAGRRKPPRGRVGVTGATGKPRAPGRSEDRTGILRDRRAFVRTAGLNPPQSLLGDEEMRFSDRTPPLASAGGKPPLGVGSPARHRTDESPERVEASATAPSGLSRCYGGGTTPLHPRPHPMGQISV